MTEETSRKKGNLLTYLLIAAAGLGMVFIGVPVFNRQGASRNVATVNGENIPIAQFNRAVSEEAQRFTALPRQQLQEMALERLIDETLLRQHALASGYRLADKTLYQEVKARFGDNETYENWLRQNRISARSYETNLRDSLAVQKYYRLLDNATIASEAEMEILLSLLAEKRDMNVITLPLAEKAQNLAVTEDDLNAFYDAHKSDYLSPEKVSLRYVIFDADALIATQSVTEVELEAEKSELAAMEQRSGRYVLFAETAAADTAEQAITEGRKTFDDIYRAVEQGEVTGEANALDLHRKGEGPSRQADEHLFSLQKIGDASALFTTEYGPMLVSLGAIEAEKMPEDAELRRRIAARKSQDTYHEIANEAFDKAQGNGTLEEIAQLTRTQVRTLSEITAETSEPEWLNQEEIRHALFGNNALAVNTIAEPVELDDKRSLFYQVGGRIAPQQLSYERVTRQVERDYRTATATAELEKTATRIIATMTDQPAVKTLVAANGGKIEEYKGLGRFDPISALSPALTATLLAQNQRLARNEDADGNIIISEITRIVPGKSDTIPEATRRNLAAQASIRRGVAIEQGFAGWLRTRAKVSVARELLEEKPEE